MRALSGAIIAAGALIGLGLTAIGLGTRYQDFNTRASDGAIVFIRFRDLDTSLILMIVVLLVTLLVGLAVTFLGLAYHHERRHREHLTVKHAGAPSVDA